MRFLAEANGKVGFAIGLSHQVKHFDKLDISLVDSEGNAVAVEVSSAVA